MKKILLPLMAVAALLTACDEERYDAPQFQKGVTFTVPDFIEEAGTRVAVTIDNSGANFTWTEGDTLGVFPSNGYQTAFPISGGAGTNTAVFDGADWALRPNASYAAYYPFEKMNFDRTSIPVSYLGQVQDGNGSTAHLGDYDYLAAKYTTVSASGDVNFTLNHLGCLVRFQLTMPEADTYTNMTLSCEGSMLTTVGKFDLTAATPALTAKSQDESISLALTNVATTEANQVLTLYMMLPPMDLSGKNLSVKVSGDMDYETIIPGKKYLAGTIYGYSNITAPAHEFIDLGLPSGIKWATCNVGANKPEEYGDYFAWGETRGYNSGKTYFTWSTYKWCHHGLSSSTMTKYCTTSDYGTVDNKTVLDASDDAATVNWGGPWRMPTDVEFTELRTKCTWTWTTMNGVNGYIIHGPNGNSIFLPAAGYYYNSSLYRSRGRYWSSSLSVSRSDYACYLDFSSGYKDINNYYRYEGRSVRPVYMPNEVKVESISLSKTNLTLTEGGSTTTLTASVLPSNASNTNVRWFSSNTSVATVSENGVVTSKALGICTITAVTMDGTNQKASCTVMVESSQPIAYFGYSAKINLVDEDMVGKVQEAMNNISHQILLDGEEVTEVVDLDVDYQCRTFWAKVPQGWELSRIIDPLTGEETIKTLETDNSIYYTWSEYEDVGYMQGPYTIKLSKIK